MILDGKKIAKKIYNELKNELKTLDIKPKLAVILVGNNSSSLRYIRQKEKWAKYIGMDFELINMPENTKEEIILNKIKELNLDTKVSGFIVQLPLPKGINENKIINSIDPTKDIDGFNQVNKGKIMIGDKSGFSPCTPKGIMEIFKEENIDLKGKNITVIGRSNIVGKPIASMLINAGATVSVCNSATKDLTFYTQNSDIIISATGQPGLIKKEMINPKTIIIDVGFTVIDGKIYGDCDFESINNQGNLITPVPGGVGVLTVAMLMKNTLKSYKNKYV